MLPLINMFWFGDRLPALHRMCIASFVQQGHPVNLYCYRPPDGVPQGVHVCDAGEIVDESNIFKSTGGSYALFADQFRYELLHRHGGWWADCDVYCLQPFRFDTPYVFGLETANRINNAVLKLPPDCELTRRLIEKGRELGSHRQWRQAAWVFHNAVMDLGLHRYALPPKVFYPVPAVDWGSVLRSGCVPDVTGAVAVHLWGEMIRRHDPDLMDGPFASNSMARALWQRVFSEDQSEADHTCNSRSTS